MRLSARADDFLYTVIVVAADRLVLLRQVMRSCTALSRCVMQERDACALPHKPLEKTVE
jgi:hypothetical protein